MHDNVRVLPTSARLRAVERPLPNLPNHHVPRQRLAERLLANDRRLTLICAPAGFGKSVLLNECARQVGLGTRTLWIDLQGQPLEPADLLARLAAALRLPHGDGEPGSELRQMLSRYPQPLWIFLDDFPSAVNPALDDCLARLLEHSPHTLRWWISSRRRPAWNLPRLRLQNDVQWVSADDLLLNERELSQLLKQFKFQLPAELQTQLLRCSEGWFAGVCLLLLDSSIEQLAARLATPSKLLLDYFEREVLAELPTPCRQALFTLAHMPRFSTDLSHHLLEGEADAQIVAELCARQLCIRVPDEHDEGFRLWQLLATTLKRLPSDRTAHHVHTLACQWFAARGDFRAAVEHALLAGQPEVAASYLQRYGHGQLLIGQSVAQFLQWRNELPASLLASTPKLIIMQAWALILCMRLDEVDACLADLVQLLPQPSAHKQRQLLAHYQAVLGVLHRLRGLASARPHCEAALEHLSETTWSSRILCHQALAQQATAELDLARGQQHSGEGLRLARAHGSVLFETLLSVDIVHQLIMQGEGARATELLEQSLQLLLANELHGPIRARLQLLRGVLRANAGEADIARAAFEQGVSEAESCGDAYLLFGYLGLAELSVDEGKLDGAQRLLDLAEQRMRQLHVPESQYRDALQLAQGELWLAEGQLERAAAIVQAVCQRLGNQHYLVPHGFYDLPLRARLSQARVELALGNLELAGQQLHSLKHDCLHSGHYSLATQVQLHLAETLEMAGEHPRADECLLVALTQAQQQQLIKPLLALQLRQAPWLEELFLRHPEFAALRHQLLRVSKQYQGASLVIGPELSKRELTVLDLVAKGYSNLEIAEALYISVHTVKSHARRINTKLGVHRRTQAVAWAKSEGLI
ncbi:LuxR C-terminal-related transcriptional regulator [Zestomonas insulae]|nr:LuxR C-terminal-related transcriptional regulator [Pseudomonas insulae]